MWLWELLMKYNHPWSKREILYFCICMVLTLLVSLILVLQKKIILSQAVGVLLLLTFLCVVLESTVFTRVPGDTMTYELEFLWSWKAVLNGSPGMLEECLLNLLLLLPAGMIFPFLFQKHHPVLLGFFLGVILSVSIECLQLFLSRGLFEWDDIFHNSLGSMAGFWTGNKLKKIIDF